MTSRRRSVSADDRARLDRQASALRAVQTDDEGTPEWRARQIEELDEDRARQGIAPLKTETELHRRARDLGLIRR